MASGLVDRLPRMVRRARCLVGLLVSLSFAVAMSTTSAHAETYRHQDVTRDVWHDSYGVVTIARADRIGDITRFKVRLGKHNLVLRVWYRQVYAKGTLNQIWWFRGQRGILGAQYTLADDVVTMNTKAGTYPSCAGSSVVVDARRDTSTATIPLSCLKSPDRIRVAPQFKGYFYKANPRYLSYDLGMVKGVGGTKFKYSRWIAAG